MKNTKKLLLVHQKMKSTNVTQAVNIMLTPQFYILKKEKLPLRYAYQAKNIAPSLFEGLLEEGARYEYKVFKEKDMWVFIAYDSENIRDFLFSKGIKEEYVSKVFFAEQALESFVRPLHLNDKESMLALDNAVVLVPKGALGEQKQDSLVFDNHFTPKSAVSIQGEKGSFIHKKQAMYLSAACVLFALMFFIEGRGYGGNSKASEAQMNTLLEAYPSLSSSYTRDSFVEKYEHIDQAERNKRAVVKSFSNMIFKGVTLTTLSLNEKTFKATFSHEGTEIAQKLKSLAAQEKYKLKEIENSTSLEIGGVL
ncbi:MAG: hypothetical protein DRQ78_04490 [Epsilonproteobacteria bacterium]|nr:MAG: hypothetical protein DRQ78_04490 [Campylobacterota bacterium]